MIRFEKIRWKNFLSTGNNFTEIDFKATPTTLVVGHNTKSKTKGFKYKSLGEIKVKGKSEKIKVYTI